MPVGAAGAPTDKGRKLIVHKSKATGPKIFPKPSPNLSWDDRAGYFGFGLAQLWVQILHEIEVSRPDPGGHLLFISIWALIAAGYTACWVGVIPSKT